MSKIKSYITRFSTAKFWYSFFLQLLFLTLVVFFINLYQSRHVVDQEAPQLIGTSLTGETINLYELTLNKPVIIYFWGSWCPICQFTSPMVNKLAKDHQVITIALSSGNQNEVNKYLLDNDYQFDTINDPNGVISNQWGVAVTPTIVIINSDRNISSVITGLTSHWSIIIRMWLAD